MSELTPPPDLSPDQFAEVRLLRLPVQLWAQVQEHTDALLREFTLISQQLADHERASRLPARLIALVEQIGQAYSGISSEPEQRLMAAAQAGLAEIDLVYRTPPQAAAAAVHLGRLLDEADEECRSDRYLLTLASTPEEKRFRDWFLDQFVTQIQGAAPVAWPDYVRASRTVSAGPDS